VTGHDAPSADDKAPTSVAANRARLCFADNVRGQRGARTQEAIEATSGLEQSRLSRVERAETGSAHFELLVALCLALGCLPSDLYDGLDEVVAAARGIPVPRPRRRRRAKAQGSMSTGQPMTGWDTTITPEMEAWIDAELSKAPPLTEDKVRALLAASGARRKA
jgi:DNA-binding Xre family transcriptional regulator